MFVHIARLIEDFGASWVITLIWLVTCKDTSVSSDDNNSWHTTMNHFMLLQIRWLGKLLVAQRIIAGEWFLSLKTINHVRKKIKNPNHYRLYLYEPIDACSNLNFVWNFYCNWATSIWTVSHWCVSNNACSNWKTAKTTFHNRASRMHTTFDLYNCS